MTDADTLMLLEMSLTLARNDEPKVFCDAEWRNPRTRYRVAACTLHEGHDGSHIDTHEGWRWGR